MYVLCSIFIKELVGCIFTMTLDTHISCKTNRTQIVQRLKCQLLDRAFFCCRKPKRISWTWCQNFQKQTFHQKPFFTSHPAVFLSRCYRCYLLDGISKGAWLNRSSIIFAGNDKWSVDPRVSIVSSVGDKHEYSLQIKKVDVSDDGQYTCSIQSERNPWPKLLNLIVKGTFVPVSGPTASSSSFFFFGTCLMLRKGLAAGITPAVTVTALLCFTGS